ncbi:MAG TPA: amidohydrolase family protein [Povalibacter sp.]|uniref:amidohydrolase family protein n=1 Tax=Povalibacter sp. TaxID=1962978 RepID=UPI002BDA55BD|nr:amidohydrolase family protein [Povalibacter sp.]HMN43034.1 amidohydrolase family protein [Povalibacter sp.]
MKFSRGVSVATSAAKVVIPPSGRIRLDGGTIVDPRTGELTGGVSILVEQGRIASIDDSRAAQSDAAARRIDVTGKFVVPGYNDMHSHVLELENPDGALALMLAEGVTGFRQMSGSVRLLEQRRSQTLPISRLAPALLELPGDILTPLNATSAEAVATEIASQQRQGADFVKAGMMGPEVFSAALREAKRLGIPLLGHLQEGVEAKQAAIDGFRSIEHLGPGATIWAGCSSIEADLMRSSGAPNFDSPLLRISFVRSLLMRLFKTVLINPAAFAAPAHVERLQRALDTYDEKKCQALIGCFVAHDTWHVPTLVRLRSSQLADAAEYQQSAYLDYMPAASVKKWRKVTARFKRLPRAMRDTYAQAYARQLELTRDLANGGVRLMTGTDGGWLAGPGLTLQEEFAELASAGLSPLQILRMTTVNAAEYLARTQRMGTVEAGRDADLVVLDANPLLHVDNLSRIAAVVRAGFHYSRDDLDRLRSRVAAGRGFLSS